MVQSKLCAAMCVKSVGHDVMYKNKTIITVQLASNHLNLELYCSTRIIGLDGKVQCGDMCAKSTHGAVGIHNTE